MLANRSADVTVFAPSNTAYSNRARALVSALAEDAQAALVRHVTTVHVVPGRYPREALVDGLRLTALDGTVLTVQREGDLITIDGVILSGEPARAVNGFLYTSDVFLLPDVDLYDTLLLRGYLKFVALVRQVGLETAYRTTVRTAFVLPDTLLGEFPTSPDLALVLRRTATADFLPRLDALALPYTFTALNGDTRTINSFDCRLTSADRGCSPYGLELRTTRRWRCRARSSPSPSRSPRRRSTRDRRHRTRPSPTTYYASRTSAANRP